MTPPLLEVRALVKRYERRTWRGTAAGPEAVASVSFGVEAGEMFGLVGESGSGKTTLARCILRLVEPTSGEVRYRGENVLAYDRAALKRWRREAQMIFQDPAAALNPRLRVGVSVREPFEIHEVGSRQERDARVAGLLTRVGLEPAVAERYPHELSGGQRQRVCVARAVALSPSLLVADEAVSALDGSIQAQVVGLLLDLQQQLGLTCLFISHDLRLVQRVCTRVAVMHRGRIVEMAPVARLFEQPAHPYTRALLAAIPWPDPDAPAPGTIAQAFDTSAPLTTVGPDHWAAV